MSSFQSGRSHILLVSEKPGEDHGPLGVVTLEDVVEVSLDCSVPTAANSAGADRQRDHCQYLTGRNQLR
jgi:hypothetical protein